MPDAIATITLDLTQHFRYKKKSQSLCVNSPEVHRVVFVLADGPVPPISRYGQIVVAWSHT